MITVLKRRDSSRLVLLGKITEVETSLVAGRENPIAMIFRLGHERPNLLMVGSVNHHRPAVLFREPQKEQLQR